MGLAAEVEAANVDGGGCSTCATRRIVSVPMGFDTAVERVGGYAVVLPMRSDRDVVLPRTV
jgi:hypothetical protein